jgi:hypothetical protein
MVKKTGWRPVLLSVRRWVLTAPCSAFWCLPRHLTRVSLFRQFMSVHARGEGVDIRARTSTKECKTMRIMIVLPQRPRQRRRARQSGERSRMELAAPKWNACSSFRLLIHPYLCLAARLWRKFRLALCGGLVWRSASGEVITGLFASANLLHPSRHHPRRRPGWRRGLVDIPRLPLWCFTSAFRVFKSVGHRRDL